MKIRTTQSGRSARFDVEGVGIVGAYFVAKGPAKTAVTLQFERLPTERAVERVRAEWRERLARLAEHLAG